MPDVHPYVLEHGPWKDAFQHEMEEAVELLMETRLRSNLINAPFDPNHNEEVAESVSERLGDVILRLDALRRAMFADTCPYCLQEGVIARRSDNFVTVECHNEDCQAPNVSEDGTRQFHRFTSGADASVDAEP
jgi:hypothetical protein